MCYRLLFYLGHRLVHGDLWKSVIQSSSYLWILSKGLRSHFIIYPVQPTLHISNPSMLESQSHRIGQWTVTDSLDRYLPIALIGLTSTDDNDFTCLLAHCPAAISWLAPSLNCQVLCNWHRRFLHHLYILHSATSFLPCSWNH